MNQEYGCKHYKRNCLLIAPCCKRIYPCRHCHNENEKHNIDRFNIQSILCLYCGFTQTVNNKCINCKKLFSKFYCNICKLWDEYPFFHCKKCKICYKGNKKKYFHCNECKICMEILLKGVHNHVEDTIKSNCFLCAEYLTENNNEIVIMNCCHSIHKECFLIYRDINYQCPICHKSIGDCTIMNKKITKLLATNLVENDVMCEITCYDCRKTFIGKYSFIYNRCLNCFSYNTQVNEVFKSTEN